MRHQALCNLAHVFGTQQHLELRFSHDSSDGLAQRRVIVLGHFIIARGAATLLVAHRLITNLPIRRVAQARDAAEKFSVFEAVGPQECRRLFIVSQVAAECAVRAELHHRRFHTLGARLLQ